MKNTLVLMINYLANHMSYVPPNSFVKQIYACKQNATLIS
jgi:hypothetical protein